ncbi:hypothetical protein CAOG_08978, partial [Capsaspora owczarzaki ATCC 30864]
MPRIKVRGRRYAADDGKPSSSEQHIAWDESRRTVRRADAQDGLPQRLPVRYSPVDVRVLSGLLRRSRGLHYQPRIRLPPRLGGARRRKLVAKLAQERKDITFLRRRTARLRRAARKAVARVALEGTVPELDELLRGVYPRNRERIVNFNSRVGPLAPLHLAAQRGNAGMVAALRKAGADANLPDDVRFDWATPLHHAVRMGHLHIASLLLTTRYVRDTRGEPQPLRSRSHPGAAIDARGVDLAQPARADVVDGRGVTPLMVACLKGDVAMARLLLEHGASVHAVSRFEYLQQRTLRFSGNAFLGGAAGRRTGNVSLEYARPFPASTPLHNAARSGSVELVRLLLARGASHAAQDFEGRDALMSAAQFGHVDVVRALLQAGAVPTNLSTAQPEFLRIR